VINMNPKKQREWVIIQNILCNEHFPVIDKLEQLSKKYRTS